MARSENYEIGRYTAFLSSIDEVLKSCIGRTIYTINNENRLTNLQLNPSSYRYKNMYFNGNDLTLGTAYFNKDYTVEDRPYLLDDLYENGLIDFTETGGYYDKHIRRNGYMPSDFELYSNREKEGIAATNKNYMSVDDYVMAIPTETLFGSSGYTFTTYIPRKKDVRQRYLFYQEYPNTNITDFSDESTSTLDNVTVNVIEQNDELEKKSLLHKTNKLFRENKIHSLVNRFCTGKQGDAAKEDLLHSAFTEKYGFSRGRNLLREKSVTINGYENPYCRVWTSHYQYSKFTSLIRPFINDSGDGFKSIKELQANLGYFRPNSGAKRLNDYTVLQDNGMPKIAPNVDDQKIKNCMISIENLAWKDSGPFNYGSLSKEQKGPNGGRIMWFPPYDLSFDDKSTPQWEPTNFIGRGESIKTYKNTDRSGSLSFTLVVDHPSLVDVFKENDKDSNYESEQKILRFFAGCDSLSDISAPQNGSDMETEEQIPDAPNIEGDEFVCIVLYPNNYSGIDYKSSPKNAFSNFFKSLYSGGYEYGVNEESLTHSNPYCDKAYEKSRQAAENNPSESANTLDTCSYGFNSKEFIDKYKLWKEDNSKFTQNETDIFDYFKEFFKIDEYSGIISFEELYNLDSFDSLFNYFSITSASSEFYEATAIVDSNATTHGHAKDNEVLSSNRGIMLKKLVKNLKLIKNDNKIEIGEHVVVTPSGTKKDDRSSLEAKLGRSAIIRFTFKNKTSSVPIDSQSHKSASGSSTVTTTNKVMSVTTFASNSDMSPENEYTYFNKLKESNSLTYDYICEKIKYFNPAFHSITPEGFNARLTFLHQCTRQGPTVAASDTNGNSDRQYGAGNLSFGMAPYCILRIGDFIHSKICINNLSIEFGQDKIQWDLNPEGIGVQPMFAKVTLQFDYIGGSDITGPIEKLQNAISSNFYANTSIYDKRSDRK